MEQDPSEVADVERSTWDRCAPTYMEVAPLTAHAVEDLIAAADLSEGCRALEVACGPGHITARMGETGATVTGVDIAPNMIMQAAVLQAGLEFRVGDVDDLPFENDRFDAVLANFAIHHFARPDRAVGEILRVLKPGGRFVFAGPLEHFAFWAFIAGLMEHHTMEDLAHGPIYMEATREDYEKLVVDAGFREYEVTERVIPLHQDSLDAVLALGWEMCELSKLPEDTQEKIRATATEKAAPFMIGSGYEFPDRIVLGVARK